jgi:hypothetical protein
LTVQSSTARQAYATNGTTGPFTVPFYFIDNSHIDVYYADADGVETLLTITTHYTVSGAGNPAGGSITLVTGYASGGTITIIRDVPLTQLVDYLTADAFPADSHERALDLIVMALQMFAEQLSRSMLFGVSEGAITFPDQTDRAGNLLGFDEDGLPVVVPPEVAFATLKKESLWFPSSAMTARTTNGPAVGSAELSGNKVMVPTLDFDSATNEYCQFNIGMPKSWNEAATFSFIPVWLHGATTVNFNVQWKMRLLALRNDDAMDAAFGTAQSSTDTGGTTNDLYTGPESSVITPSGTLAQNNIILAEFFRETSGVSGNMAIDAKLFGVFVFFWRDAETDE